MYATPHVGFAPVARLLPLMSSLLFALPAAAQDSDHANGDPLAPRWSDWIERHEVEFVDENVGEVDFGTDADLVAVRLSRTSWGPVRYAPSPSHTCLMTLRTGGRGLTGMARRVTRFGGMTIRL